MINDKFVKLNQIITTKILHDLSGPIGNVYNSIEMLISTNPSLAQSSSIRHDAKNILDASSAKLMQRLKLYKYLYNPFLEDDQISFNDGILTLSQIFDCNSDRITIKGNCATISSNILRVVACLIMIIDARQKISTIQIVKEMSDSQVNAEYKIYIMVSDKSLTISDITKQILSNSDLDKEFELRYTYEYYAVLLANCENYKISVQDKSDQIIYHLQHKN
ncbi:MAG: hypothetical protein AB8B67_03330 [Rickettsiaceae bacterium]